MWLPKPLTMSMRFRTCLLVMVFVCGLCQFSMVQARIFSRDTYDYVQEPGVIHLSGDNKDFLSRVRRAADSSKTGGGSGSSNAGKDGGDIGTDAHLLPDKNHNEAIVHWTGNESSTLFVLTREHNANGSVPDSKLWRSDDYGKEFKPVNLGDDVLIRYYFFCSLNRNKLLFTDTKNRHVYRTEDGGKNFEPSSIDISPDYLMFHPTQENWVLAYDFKDRILQVSMDLGRSWNLVSNFVNSRFQWAVAGLDNDSSTVHMEVQDPDTGRYTYKACAKPYCKDITISNELAFIDMGSLLVQNEYIFVQKSTQFSSALYVSYNRGPFKQAYFPFDMEPQNYFIVNTDESQVFVAADHKDRQVNLYMSDTTGQFYVLSLEQVVSWRYKSFYYPDLYEVKGVLGTYIVNQRTGNTRHTLITFDKGGTWQPIPAPDKDADQKDTNCKLPDCGLHLHLELSWFFHGIPYILSEKNAPGMILAQGTIGKELTANDSTLFLSSNGGLTWKALLKGKFYSNILDQGGALIAVNESSLTTKEIWYSCTEGGSWNKYAFYQSPIQVDGVLNEPGINTLMTSIYGHLDNDTGWVIVRVDFGNVLSRLCDNSDYEMWVPTDAIKDHHCLLGQQLQYHRRKKSSECHNGRDYEHAVNITACPCIDEDYECDFGYERHGDTCKPTSWFNPDVPVGDCPEGSSYSKSKGYRKIAADKCIDQGVADKYKSVKVQCPLIKAQGLTITTEKLTVPTHINVTFHLSQNKGSKKSTKYQWDFGDGSKSPGAITGFEKAKTQNHSYTLPGFYTVNVTASNNKGNAGATLMVHVEERIVGLYVETPHGAQVTRPVKFEAEPVSRNFTSEGMGNVHFLWTFGDEGPEDKPLLSFEQKVNHTYSKPGNYNVMVEAMNSVGPIFKLMSLPVYATLETVQLTFDSDTNRLMEDTVVWRAVFADMVKTMLVNVLEVAPERLEVVVMRGYPTRADVSILPEKQDQTSDSYIHPVVSKLMQKAKEEQLVVEIGHDDFGDGKASVVEAKVITDDEPGKKTKKKKVPTATLR